MWLNNACILFIYLFIYSVIFLPFLSYNQSLESVGSMHLLQVLAFLVGFANYN